MMPVSLESVPAFVVRVADDSSSGCAREFEMPKALFAVILAAEEVQDGRLGNSRNQYLHTLATVTVMFVR